MNYSECLVGVGALSFLFVCYIVSFALLFVVGNIQNVVYSFLTSSRTN